MSDNDNDIDGLLLRLSDPHHSRHRDALTALVAERDALQKQRDEARQEICELVAASDEASTGLEITRNQIAAERGWDCFNERGGA